MDSTCEESSSFSSSSEQHKSGNKVQSLFVPLPLWHKVVQGIPVTLQEHLEAIEQSVTQLHPHLLNAIWFKARQTMHQCSPQQTSYIYYDSLYKNNRCIHRKWCSGCYNRLINSLLLLQLRRLGTPKSAMSSLSNTWSQTTHHIRTQFSISQESYTNSSDTPLFGPGQLSSASGEESIENVGDAFVDDAYLGATSSYIPDETLHFQQTMQHHRRSATENLQSLGQKWEKTSLLCKRCYQFAEKVLDSNGLVLGERQTYLNHSWNIIREIGFDREICYRSRYYCTTSLPI